MADKVTFDGPNKLIIVDFGITDLDVRVDVYSAWKRWTTLADNGKYQQAMRSVGGDPLPGGKFLGSTFFLMNGWKIRPFEGDHALTINGNLFTEDGSSPFARTIGNFNVTISLSTSSLVEGISTTGGTTDVDFADLLDNQFIESGLTMRQAMRLMAAVLAGQVSGAGSSIMVFKNAVQNSKDRVVAEVDENGNRTGVSYDLN